MKFRVIRDIKLLVGDPIPKDVVLELSKAYGPGSRGIAHVVYQNRVVRLYPGEYEVVDEDSTD